MGGVRRGGAGDAGAGPGGLPSQGARHRHARGGAVVVHLDRRGAAVQPRHLLPVRLRQGAGVLPGLADREGAVGRQPVRIPGGVLLLRGAGAPAAPRAVLGDRRRADHARPVHRHRRGAAGHRPLRALRVRRVPDLHGGALDARRRRRGAPGAQPGAGVVQAVRARDARIRRHQLLRPPGRRCSTRRRCSSCWWSSKRPTSCSRSIRSPPCSA